MMKVCSKCGASKDSNEFYKQANTPDGHSYTCKICASVVGAFHRKLKPKASIERAIRQRKKLREEILTTYGSHCVCCGETEPVFLALDHINNDGAAHRAAVKNIYRDVKKRGFPKDEFQLLCHNCNMAKHLLGECPHVHNSSQG